MVQLRFKLVRRQGNRKMPEATRHVGKNRAATYFIVHLIQYAIERTRLSMWASMWDNIRCTHYSMFNVSTQLNCATLGLAVKCSPALMKMVFALKTAIWQGELDFGEWNVVVFSPATCSDYAVAYILTLSLAIGYKFYCVYRLDGLTFLVDFWKLSAPMPILLQVIKCSSSKQLCM